MKASHAIRDHNPTRILVVEDDARLAALIRDYLQQQGFEVFIEARGDTAPPRILAERPDLLILDLMLPGRDGLSVCQQIRADYTGPILILTAREDDMDQVAGLEMGADDYVKKPVEPRVLLARIRALLRRFQAPVPTLAAKAADAPAAEIQFGSLRINREAHAVELAGDNVVLTTNEFELLLMLADNAGKVLDRQTLYADLRGIDYDGLDRAMDVMVSRLRRKLGDDAHAPRRIKTIWGQGYLFVKDAW
jgi:DNA-binding response OmpR family regulator